MFWDFGLIDLVWEWFRWFLSIPHPQKDQVQPWFHGKRAGWWLEPWNPWAPTVGSWVPPHWYRQTRCCSQLNNFWRWTPIKKLPSSEMCSFSRGARIRWESDYLSTYRGLKILTHFAENRLSINNYYTYLLKDNHFLTTFWLLSRRRFWSIFWFFSRTRRSTISEIWPSGGYRLGALYLAKGLPRFC